MIQFLRGSTLANASYVGAVGSLTIDLDLGLIHIHDGVNAGGWIVGSVNGSGDISSITGESPIIISGTVENPIISIQASTDAQHGYMSLEDKGKLDGVESGAQVNTVTSVNSFTGAVDLTKSDLGLSNVQNVDTTDATNITSGVLDLARIPVGALERLVTVADETARYALTTAQVQDGDTVKQLDTEIMYRVVDDTQLNLPAGYVEYSAGRAAAVPWSGIEDKPLTFSPTAHNNTAHSEDYTPQTRSVTAGTGLSGGGTLEANIALNVDYGSIAGTSCEGNDARLSDAREPTAHDNTAHSVDFTPETRTVTAGNGLAGGGTLASDLTLNLGAPGGLTGATLNAVTSSSHTHSVTLTASDVDAAPINHQHDISNVTGLQAALDEKAPINNPTFTGTVTIDQGIL